MTGLTHLDLRGTLVNDVDCEQLKPLARLAELDVGSTKFGGDGCQGLPHWAHLTSLRADSSYMDDRGCSTIGSLPTLARLDLSRTNVGDLGIEALIPLANTLQVRLAFSS